MNISAKLKVSASKSATSPSCKTLPEITLETQIQLVNIFFKRKNLQFKIKPYI